MNQDAFERQRRPVWKDFEKSIEAASGMKKGSKTIDSELFLEEYRKLNRDLALAQSRGYSQELIDYLNTQVSEGHRIIHVQATHWWETLWNYISGGFPKAIREARTFVYCASAAFLVPAFGLIFLIEWMDPTYLYSVLDPSTLEQLERMYDPGNSRIGHENQSDRDFVMFGFYIMNNVSIALRVFAWGLLFGVGSILILCFNGVYIGAAAYHLTNIGYTSTFWTFVIAHGAFELTAIVLAGAAGLMLGYSLLAPGRQTRLDALKNAALKSIQIMAGVVVMLVLAAFVEAFWSSNRWMEPAIKYVVGAILWLLVFYYFIFVGRRAT